MIPTESAGVARRISLAFLKSGISIVCGKIRDQWMWLIWIVCVYSGDWWKCRGLALGCAGRRPPRRGQCLFVRARKRTNYLKDMLVTQCTDLFSKSGYYFEFYFTDTCRFVQYLYRFCVLSEESNRNLMGPVLDIGRWWALALGLGRSRTTTGTQTGLTHLMPHTRETKWKPTGICDIWIRVSFYDVSSNF